MVGIYVIELAIVMAVALEKVEGGALRSSQHGKAGPSDCQPGRDGQRADIDAGGIELRSVSASVPAVAFAGQAASKGKADPAELERAADPEAGSSLIESTSLRAPAGAGTGGGAVDSVEDSASAAAGRQASNDAGAESCSDRTEAKSGSAPAPSPRSVWWTALNFGFLGAAAVSSLTYVSMASLMNATPLVMIRNGFAFDDTVIAVAGHLLGMYLPSLFSGKLAKRMGPELLAVLGCAVQAAGNAWFLAGTDLGTFVGAIVVVGVGWNFAYVGASAIVPGLVDELVSADAAAVGLPQQAVSADRAKAIKTFLIGLFDTLNLLGTAIVSLATGALLDSLGSTAFWLVWLGISVGIFIFSVIYAAVRARCG